MTDKLLIDRELLERVAKPVLFRSHGDAHADACAELRAILAQPAAPADGEAVEVVGWHHSHAEVATSDKARVVTWLPECIEPLVRLSDHQRAIAELREQYEGAESQAEYQRDRAEHFEAERDTLRQQLAERDAIIERLETGIPRIQEQSHQMRQQRDKLAGLLRDERNWNCVEISCQRGVKGHCLCGTCRILRIDAALAEVK